MRRKLSKVLYDRSGENEELADGDEFELLFQIHQLCGGIQPSYNPETKVSNWLAGI